MSLTSALERARYHLPEENKVDFNMDIEGCCGNIGTKAKLCFCGLSTSIGSNLKFPNLEPPNL